MVYISLSQVFWTIFSISYISLWLEHLHFKSNLLSLQKDSCEAIRNRVAEICRSLSENERNNLEGCNTYYFEYKSYMENRTLFPDRQDRGVAMIAESFTNIVGKIRNFHSWLMSAGDERESRSLQNLNTIDLNNGNTSISSCWAEEYLDCNEKGQCQVCIKVICKLPGTLDGHFPELIKRYSQTTIESEPLQCVYAEERESRALECYQLGRMGGLQEIAENMLVVLSKSFTYRVYEDQDQDAQIGGFESNECINMRYNFEQLQDYLSDLNASSADTSVHQRLVGSMILEANGFKILLNSCGEEYIRYKEKGGRQMIDAIEQLKPKFAKKEFLGWTAFMENL